MTTQEIQPIDSRKERSESRPGMAHEMADDLHAQAEPQAASISRPDESRSEDPHAELRAPYLPDGDTGAANHRWQDIQAAFVDDPRKAVTQAHQLVGELTQQIVDAFAQERSDLERQWSKGDSVSTEDLRVCLQRYRAFFSRLLPSVNRPQPD